MTLSFAGKGKKPSHRWTQINTDLKTKRDLCFRFSSDKTHRQENSNQFCQSVLICVHLWLKF
ncbi:MAG: hypothetical protein KDE20_29055, partial [Caldilineaceae bacterium]|nr:hypothetical protein [Caldilineaceae bacterium]